MTENIYNPINQRFVEAYKYLNATTNGLAKSISVSQRSVWNFVNGVSVPTAVMVRKLCAKYPELSFDYIMYGTGSILRSEDEIANDVNNHRIEETQPVLPVTDPQPSSLMESIYKKLIKSYEEQIELLKVRCASLEETNKKLQELANSKD